MSEPIDLAAITANHQPRLKFHPDDRLEWCRRCGKEFPCPTYRLAEALAAEQAKVARVAELAHRFELIPRARLLGALTARPVNVSGLDDMRDNEGAGQAAPA